MTMNGHFASKSVSGLASNWLAFCLSDKSVRKFADLYASTLSGKNVGHGLQLSFMVAFAGVPRRGSVKWKNSIHSSSR